MRGLTFLFPLLQPFSTPWQTAGSAAATSCHYTDYHPCQSHALPSPGVGTVGKLAKEGVGGATSEDTGGKYKQVDAGG